MKKKKKISVQTIIEVMIRAVFFIIYPALFSTAFTGIKLIVEQITQRASLPWNSFVQTLVVLLVFTIVFGRFFCGFACAFGTWGDFVYFTSIAPFFSFFVVFFFVVSAIADVLSFASASLI